VGVSNDGFLLFCLFQFDGLWLAGSCGAVAFYELLAMVHACPVAFHLVCFHEFVAAAMRYTCYTHLTTYTTNNTMKTHEHPPFGVCSGLFQAPFRECIVQFLAPLA
jgi:hypothetical protein